jgi:DNA-binding FrmR family transcriptional regulator
VYPIQNRSVVQPHQEDSVSGHKTRHDENLDRLARAEGQVRGIRRMVEEGAYCIDIITQIQAAQAALGAIGARILRKHVEHCVADAMRAGDEVDMGEKVDELMVVFQRCLKQ